MAARKAADPELEAAIAMGLELFEGLDPHGDVRSRRMFGGAGLYSGGVMFALVAYGALWLKADAVNAADFDAEGCPPFVYDGKRGAPVAMSYRRMPDAALDDPDEALRWGRLALGAARRAKGGA
jgi:DNA transformation protein and related proteins